MKQTIIINLQVEGIHNWPDANKLIPEVGFLSDLHRHMFHITVEKQVNHDDRDIEIIMFKRSINEFLIRNFYDTKYNMLNFKSNSCEMISLMILNHFNCTSVQVLEDGENGSKTYK